MKKIIVAAALFLMSLCFGENMSAGNFGIIGGANFHTSEVKNIGTHTLTQWHAGFLYKFNLSGGFQIQPSLVYNVKSATGNAEYMGYSVGNVELNAALQWGLDLILFRPFLEISPFAGYAVNTWGDKGLWDKQDRFECGLGLGGGLQIWRLQLSARYNWSFYDMIKSQKAGAGSQDLSFDGVSLSLAYFF